MPWSMGLKRLPETRLEKLPRMADFALWATACETALWPEGTFWSAYCGNLDEAVEGVIDADPIAAAVRALMATRTEWTGTASDLLDTLAEAAGERVAKAKTWPDSPRALSGRLRRAATFLRKIGIEIGFVREKGRARTRTISITATQPSAAPEKPGARPSAPSASSAPATKSNAANGFAPTHVRTVGADADGGESNADGREDGEGLGPMSTVRTNPLKTNATDGADGADAKSPSDSVREQAGAGIPFVITQDMRRRLNDLGYDSEAIRAMRPADAWRLLEGADKPEAPSRNGPADGAEATVPPNLPRKKRLPGGVRGYERAGLRFRTIEWRSSA